MVVSSFSVDITSSTGVYLGTGFAVSVSYENNKISEYLLIINGDLDGDGVSDVLDALLAEQFVNGQAKPETEQIYAANGYIDTSVDIEDYQNVVNCVLA